MALSSAAPETQNEAFLEVRHITKMFGRFVALEDVSLEVYPGELVCILGPSGCGKTTLLRVIAGLEEQNVGEVFLKGVDISRFPTSKRQCGIVFQSYALFPNLTASQNVAYGLKNAGMNREKIVARTKEMLDLVGLADQGRKYPAQLSGGQQQRIALARALAPNPSMLLLDEPLSALDAQVRVYLRSEIRELQQRLGITTIMVTHDQEEGLTMADRIILMKDGRLIQCDAPQVIYQAPKTTFAAGFIGAMNFFRGWKVADAGTLVMDDYVLKTANGRLAELTGRQVTLAIRPEDIRVMESGKTDTNMLLAEVRHVEFRGASYRLRLRLKRLKDSEKSDDFEADMPAIRVDRLGLKTGVHVKVHLPPDRLLWFAENS
jgi:iron(III) transport system ATP-binding protein